jgi:phenylalanyl-tRNA synthetase beta chain
MLVPLSWLREYVDIDVSVDEFAERMIMSGSNIETVRNYAEGVSGLAVGRVLSAERIAGSDHLNVCVVDVGAASAEGPLQIVCGADNVRRPGILVIVALPGAVLPGGFKIKKTKLFGTESSGMICSAQELGFEEKVVPMGIREGIWILPDDLAPGSDAVKAVGLDETVIDFEITSNRPDCLSIIGMAREAAAVFGKELRRPSAGGPGHKGDAEERASDYVDVVIERPDLCPRYVARVCRDIRIGESPFWMQRRLMFAGVRPISNIVDITNYVMLEYGHPIHAFDVRQIEGQTIVVDTAKDGERFTTLDGKERELSGDMLIIGDKAKPVAIAGVMGGLNSGIVDDTKTVIVEAANFNADSIRLTSKRLGLRSEASLRFEKGVAPELSGSAADRVCALVTGTGAGTVVAGSVDRYPGKKGTEPIRVRVGRVNAVLGTDISAGEMADILRRLDMETETDQDGAAIAVTPPQVRVDLKEEVDLIEEIARIYGYNELGATLHRDASEASASVSWRLRTLVRTALAGMGYSEIQTYSFVSPGGADKIMLPPGSERRSFVRLINPLGEENSVMRTLLLPNLLDMLSGNFNRGNARARLFEIGNTFRDAGGELPEERLALSIGSYGYGGFSELKGAVEALFAKLGLRGARYRADADTGSWHPGRCARIELPSGGGQEDVPVGHMGEVHPDVLKNCGIGVPAFAAELDLAALILAADMTREYVPLRRYPAVTLDIALLADEDVTVFDITEAARLNGGALLESITLFDVYRGEQIAEGKKSLAFNLVYRADDRTLTDEEVGKVHARILAEIAGRTGAALREV